MTLQTRVSKLETASKAGGVVVLFKHVEESTEQARERWHRERPGKSLDDAALQVMIVRWLDPQQWGTPP